MRKRMNRLMALILSGVMTSVMMTGCGSSAGTDAVSDTVSGESAEETGKTETSSSTEVNVICWSEYLPQDVLDSFESKNGIKVNMTTYTSPDDMLAKVQSAQEGTYDLIIGPENYTPIFNTLEVLEKLDMTKLPNASNLEQKYLGRDNDPDNTYSLPYMFASAVIAVNTDVITDEITSYADLLKPEYKDQIVIIEDSRAVYSMAAMATGCEVNDTSDETLAKVEDYLTDLLPNIHAFDGDSPKTLMINGECPIGLIYGAEALLAQQEVPSIQCIYPEEGVYLGADAMMITKSGKNQDNAYALMNYILDGDVSASISEIFPYINPNAAAVAALGEDYSSNILTNPPADAVERACTLLDIGDETSKIVELWTKIKG